MAMIFPNRELSEKDLAIKTLGKPTRKTKDNLTWYYKKYGIKVVFETFVPQDIGSQIYVS